MPGGAPHESENEAREGHKWSAGISCCERIRLFSDVKPLTTPERGSYKVVLIADYWRLMCDRKLVATYRTHGAAVRALAKATGKTLEKRKYG